MRAYAIDLAAPLFFYKAGEFTSEPGWTHNRFLHENDFEFIIGLKGHFDLVFNVNDGSEHTVRISPGTCVTLPPGAKGRGAGKTGEPVDFLWMHCVGLWHTGVLTPQSSIQNRHSDPEGVDADETIDMDSLLRQTLMHVRQRGYCPDANNLCILPERFHIRHPNRIVLALRNLLSLSNQYRYSQRGNDFLAAAALVELSHDWLEGLSETDPDSESMDGRRTAPIVEWIRAHMSADLTVTAIADQFRMNPDYLSRLFRQERGMNLRDWLSSMRIETAKVLLVRTDFPIAKVARYSHFNDSRNFIKQFKKATGLTPSTYRGEYAQTHLNNATIDPTIPMPQELRRVVEGLYI